MLQNDDIKFKFNLIIFYTHLLNIPNPVTRIFLNMQLTCTIFVTCFEYVVNVANVVNFIGTINKLTSLFGVLF